MRCVAAGALANTSLSFYSHIFNVRLRLDHNSHLFKVQGAVGTGCIAKGVPFVLAEVSRAELLFDQPPAAVQADGEKPN